MKHRMRACALFIAAALMLTACGDGGRTAPTPDRLDFSLTTLDGGTFDGSSLRGKPGVLWFWAPWCTICRAEAPEVGHAAERFKGKVTVVGVPGRGQVADMRQFVKDTGLGHLTHAVDSDGRVWAAFGVASQPAFAFIDRTGAVEMFTGSLPPADLTARMTALAS
ncbi:redoxin domain-containing protein [Nonomuraea sp. 10N515B]|uniref:redoxin domain-containing protein n=1 Tax=Nonomuraea sp. 10N515B TaxID=3457422 RepID=UPI003FCEC275